MKTLYLGIVVVGLVSSSLYAMDSSAKTAQGVLKRTFGTLSKQFVFESIPPADDKDVFEFEASDGVVTVRGSSAVAMSRGAYEYLQKYANASVFWSGTTLKLPENGKLPDAPRTRVESPYQFHYYLNVVTYGYSMPFWDWERWEKELDWMALHGINMPLALGGTEVIAYRVWKQIGLTDEEIAEYFTGPAHLPWNRMGNIFKHDGPLPKSWLKQQVDLQHQVLDRMKELGMEPIVPAFAGFVPKAITRIHPDVQLNEMGWVEFDAKFHPFLLPPDSPLFPQLGKQFIQEWEKEFGPYTYYLSDSFNEMKIPGDKEEICKTLATYGKAIYESIRDGNPDAVWVTQGWMFGYFREIWTPETVEAFVSLVPDDRMMILDLAVDYNDNIWKTTPNWLNFKAFYGKMWVYSVIPNMGGKTPLTGVLDYYATNPASTLASPKKGNLVGFGFAPEGIENNEVVYELLTDVGWSAAPIDLDAWLKRYCISRYGAYPPEMQKAWADFRKSCYGSLAWDARFGWQFRPGPGQENRVNEAPEFFRGMEAFLACADKLGDNRFYQADAIEVAANYVSFKINELLTYAGKAFEAGDKQASRKAYDEALELMLSLDRLLESHPTLRLDRWVKLARDRGVDAQQKDYYESNAKRLVTTWGTDVVDDYAAKVWTGLIRDYYVKRWGIYVTNLFGETTTDLDQWQEQWIKTPGISEIKPFENPLQAALKLVKRVKAIKIPDITGKPDQQ